tara:strand:- start:2826 stop:3614 length:789 start_codon:yes stop_codon:yes gene_type:complete
MKPKIAQMKKSIKDKISKAHLHDDLPKLISAFESMANLSDEIRDLIFKAFLSNLENIASHPDAKERLSGIRNSKGSNLLAEVIKGRRITALKGIISCSTFKDFVERNDNGAAPLVFFTGNYGKDEFLKRNLSLLMMESLKIGFDAQAALDIDILRETFSFMQPTHMGELLSLIVKEGIVSEASSEASWIESSFDLAIETRPDNATQDYIHLIQSMNLSESLNRAFDDIDLEVRCRSLSLEFMDIISLDINNDVKSKVMSNLS